VGGVIFNKVGSAYHEQLLRDAAQAAGIPVLGAIPRLGQLAVPSRHLGLIPAAELGRDAAAAAGALAAIVADGVDMEAVLRLARTAGSLPDHTDFPAERNVVSAPPPRIAVAGGAAFTFGYAEHPELLAAAGAEVVTFDPVRDEQLPEDVHGLVIGGGFPEEHAADLSANASLRAEVAALAGAGAPVIAECAGLLYLARSLDGHPMCGVLEADTEMTERLTLGYRDAVAVTGSPLGPAGTLAHGHEFHRTAVRAPGPAANAWRWASRDREVTEGFVRGRIHASYLHTHWAGVPGAAERITGAAREYQRSVR
jgi:cobyrinic acid a,c-diamide synthase